MPSGWAGDMPPGAAGERRARWRSTTVGWILAHIAIGLAIGFGVSIVEVIIASGWVSLDAMQNATDDQKAAVGGMVLLAWVAGAGTWLLFVYLRPLLWRLIAFPGALAVVTVLGTMGVVGGLRGN
ncbi:MAG: hypothetical protein M3P11_00790 [Actinomycetota bacterium]|nr:hypothetical protein [Actinomycetota bacterium]